MKLLKSNKILLRKATKEDCKKCPIKCTKKGYFIINFKSKEDTFDCWCMYNMDKYIIGDDLSAKDYILKTFSKIKKESTRGILKDLLKDNVEDIIKFTLILWKELYK